MAYTVCHYQYQYQLNVNCIIIIFDAAYNINKNLSSHQRHHVFFIEMEQKYQNTKSCILYLLLYFESSSILRINMKLKKTPAQPRNGMVVKCNFETCRYFDKTHSYYNLYYTVNVTSLLIIDTFNLITLITTFNFMMNVPHLKR
jgi:hypothetical protein